MSDGLMLVRDQFFRTLQEFGVVRFFPEGEAFDPARHEAVSVLPVEQIEDNGRVLNVLKPGYVAGENVLRAAQVVVGKLTSEDTIA